MKLRKLVVISVIILCVVTLIKSIVYNHIFPYKYKESVIRYAKEYDLDPLFVLAVIKTESNFNEDATSHKNAKGLMQITNETAEWVAQKMQIENYNLELLNNPDFNIKMGCWYLNDLEKEFKNLDLVLAAYNGGRGNVNKWLKDNDYSKNGKNLHYIPFKETDKYVKKAMANYNIYKFLYNKT